MIVCLTARRGCSECHQDLQGAFGKFHLITTHDETLCSNVRRRALGELEFNKALQDSDGMAAELTRRIDYYICGEWHLLYPRQLDRKHHHPMTPIK